MAQTRPRSFVLFEPFTNPADEWQIQLLQRFLTIALGLTVCLFLHDLIDGSNPLFAGLAIGVALTGMLVVRWRKHLSLWVAAGLFSATVLLLALVAQDAGTASVPAFCLAMLPGTMATMMQGPALGAAISGLMLATMLAMAWLHPLGSRMDAYRFSNELAMLAFGFLVAWSIDRSFKRLQAALQARTRSLKAVAETSSAMADALFQDLTPALDGLRAELDSPAADPARAGQRVQFLATKLRQARSLFPAQALDEDGLPDDAIVQLRRQVARTTLLSLLALQSLLLLRNLIWGGSIAGNAPSIVALPLLLLGQQRWPRGFTPSRVGLLLLASSSVAMARALTGWGVGAASPSLVLIPTLVLVASLLNGPWVLAAAFSYGGALLLWAGHGNGLGSRESHLIVNLGLLRLILSLIGISVVQLRQGFLQQSRQQARSMQEALRLRRRLAGTLFHDVNNQLMALATTLELAAEAGEDQGRALALARQLCERVDGLVRVSKSFLLGDSPAELRPLPVATLFRDIETLFKARLQAKSQSLFFMADGSLRVLGLPEIITESVLGNLVSNAIKFSPEGSIIEVEAVRAEGGVALRVRDAGPGIPEALLEQLDADGPLPSSPGSGGEPGQGFGLKLVREHLQRLGGRLDIKRHPQGGTLAVAWLKAA